MTGNFSGPAVVWSGDPSRDQDEHSSLPTHLSWWRDALPSITLLLGVTLSVGAFNPGLRVLVLSVFVFVTWFSTSRRRPVAITIGAVFVGLAVFSQATAVGSQVPNIGVGARAAIIVFSILQISHTVKMSSQAARWTLNTSILVALVMSFTVVARFNLQDYDRRATANYSDGLGALRQSSWFYSPNELGLVSAILVVTFAMILPRTKGFTRVLSALAMIGSAYALYESATRSAILGCIAGLLLLLILSTIKKFNISKFLAICSVCGCVLVVLQNKIYLGAREILGRDRDGSAKYRDSVREILNDRIARGEADLIGSGFKFGNQLRISELNRGIANIDNSVVYAIVGYGIIAALVLGLAVITAVYEPTRKLYPPVAIIITFLIVSYSEDAVSWPSAVVMMQIAILIGCYKCRQS